MIERKLKPEDFGFSTSTLTLGETGTTAYRGDRGKIAYEHSQEAHAPIYTSLVWDGSIFVDNPAITNDVLYIGSAAVSGTINLDNIPEGKEFILYVGDIRSGETVQLSVSGQFIPLSVPDIYLTNTDNNTFYKFVLLNGYHYVVTGGFDGTLDDIADGVTYVKVSSAEKTVWNNKADQSFSVAMAVAL